MKIKKREIGQSSKREEEPAIYFHSSGMGLHFNAAARDYLGTPEFISVELEGNKIILSKGNHEDYKVSYTKNYSQKISASMFMSGYLAKIPDRTKIYGTTKCGKLEFKIPKEYVTDECNNE